MVGYKAKKCVGGKRDNGGKGERWKKNKARKGIKRIDPGLFGEEGARGLVQKKKRSGGRIVTCCEVGGGTASLMKGVPSRS